MAKKERFEYDSIQDLATIEKIPNKDDEKKMKLIRPTRSANVYTALPLRSIPESIVETDHKHFEQILRTSLNPEQERQIATPAKTYPEQDSVLAIHWHPEFIPMELIAKRIEETFPNKTRELIIPTQHNVISSYDGYSGVEVDCYASGFNQKVQILLHFENGRLEKADVLKSMLSHTFKYRSSQLFEYIHAIIKPNEYWLNRAARKTGATKEIVNFVRIYVQKVHDLLEQNGDRVPAEMIKNKIIRDFFDCLREHYDDKLIDRAQTFLKAVKKIVKANFSLSYFYRASEVIEEARSLGAGIIIPHPEQFWPILLADYDVDGYEVWNPQSQRYTEFLISVVNRKNKALHPSKRKLILVMGDDTHMSEKARHPSVQNPAKASREVGVQPAWEDVSIRKAVAMTGLDRTAVIEEYKSRLAA
jgi:hypothetical protein